MQGLAAKAREYQRELDAVMVGPPSYMRCPSRPFLTRRPTGYDHRGALSFGVGRRGATGPREGDGTRAEGEEGEGGGVSGPPSGMWVSQVREC